MSTPIETNTEGLQEVLQQVYNLPNRSGGSSSQPDIVIDWQLPSDEFWIPDISVDQMTAALDYERVLAKLQNRDHVVAIMKQDYHYDVYEFSGTSQAVHVVYNADGNNIRVLFVFIGAPTVLGNDCYFVEVTVDSTGIVDVSLKHIAS